jgi:serine/threonine protein kinase
MDLAKYLELNTTSDYPQLRLFFSCLATALEYLYRQEIRHEDIKPSNIFIKGDQVFLADFGLSFYSQMQVVVLRPV